MMNFKHLLIACTLTLPLVSWAEPLAVGQAMPPLVAKDQHDLPWGIGAETRLVLFATGRKASNIAMEVLGQQPKGFLATRHAVYLADMSRMPGLITRTFALPSLREQPFAVGVVLDEALLSDFPRRDDAVTLIGLENSRIVAVNYAAKAETLREALGLTSKE